MIWDIVEGDSEISVKLWKLSCKKFQSNLDAGEVSYKLPPLISLENVISKVDLDIVLEKISRLSNCALSINIKF